MLSEGIVLFLLGSLVTIYFSDVGTFRILRNARFNEIIGDFNLWNYSREFRGTLVRADVRIYRRFLQTPGISVIYRSPAETWPLKGSIFARGDRLYALLDYKNILEKDPTLIVFEPLQPVWINIGLAAGFEVPPRPYAGVQLLCSKDVTAEQVVAILGSDEPEDSQCRLDYHCFSKRRHALRTAAAIE